MKISFVKHVILFSSTILFCFSLMSGETAAQSPLPQKIFHDPLYRTDCLGSENSDASEQFRAYIEEFLFKDAKTGVELYSCVNWREGFVKSEGIGKQRSRRAAELTARSNALKTLLVLNLDARFTLQQYFAGRKEVGLKIQNVLIRNAAIEYLPDDPQQPETARAMVSIPFYGISGLYSFFLDDQEIYLQPPGKETPPEQEPAEPLWLIVDARDFDHLEPALFPQILSENGDVVFSMSQVSQDVLFDEGAVEYVVATEDTQTAQRPASGLLASTSLPLFDVPVPFLKRFQEEYDLLAEVKSRKKGQGKRTIAVKAIKVSGENRPANVYVSLEEAKNLDNVKGVIILTPVGGGKGQLFEMLYAFLE